MILPVRLNVFSVRGFSCHLKILAETQSQYSTTDFVSVTKWRKTTNISMLLTEQSVLCPGEIAATAWSRRKEWVDIRLQYRIELHVVVLRWLDKTPLSSSCNLMNVVKNQVQIPPNSVFICFVWISEQTGTFALYRMHWRRMFTAR